MARRNATPRPRRPKTLRSEALDLSVHQAINTAQRWWQDNHLLDDLDSIGLEYDLNRITRVCERLGLHTYRDVVDNAACVIATAAEVEVGRLTRFSSTEQSHRLFRIRNHVGALLAAIAQDFGDDPSIVTVRLPEPAPRAGGINRACFDDEILLLRHRALHALVHGGRALMAGCQYALTEAGALPSETTTVHADDLNHLRQPTAVKLAGARYHTTRTVELPRWTHRPLTLALDEHLAHDDRASTDKIAYGGQKSGGAASAAASLMLRRTMISAGLTEDCVQPMGVVKWRAKHTLHTHGFIAAMTLLGKTKAIQVQNFIDGEDHKPSDIPESDIDSFLE
jgi:hypothetical protein